MEPLDAAKNDETTGSFKRRISSILKAPRISLKSADPQKLETPVKVFKPVEKKNSRRVSFAPADDILLFPTDVKNVAPDRSPLQDLSTTTVANAEKRVQVGVAEEGIQPITGMETLLNAPLHVSQQRKKEIFTFNHDTEDDCREKTVMFTADDASMDMTQCHTIMIANEHELCAVLPDQHCDLLPTSGNISSTLHRLDSEFENFLASLYEPSDLRGNPVMTKVVPNAQPTSQETMKKDVNVFLAQLETQRDGVDKENQAPVFTSTVMEKPLNKTWKIGEPSNRSAVFPEDDLSMDIAEAHTGHIVGNTSTDEPLKWLFPTPDLYPPSEHLKTTEITLQQQSSNVLGCTSSKANGLERTKNPTVIDSKIRPSELSSLNETRSKLDLSWNQGPPFTGKGIIPRTLQNKKRKSLAFMTNAANASNTAEDEYGVDMTKAFTVSIDHIPQSDGSRMSDKPLNSLPPKTDDEMWTLNKRDVDEVFYKESEGLSSRDGMIPSSDQSPRMDGKCHVGTKGFMPTLSDSDDIEFTRCQTRVIEVANLDVAKPVLSFSTRAPVSVLESDKKHLSEDDNGIGMMARPGEGTKCNNYKPDDMEITRSQTVAINAESLHSVNPLQNKKRKSLAFMTNAAKASNTAEDEYGVDMTKAFTVSIDHIPQSDGSRMSDKPLNSLPPKTDDEMWTLNKRDADEVFYKESEGLSSRDGMIPSSDHNPRMDGKCHVGTKGFMPTLSDSDDIEFTRCQTRVIEVANLDVAKPVLSFSTRAPVSILESDKKHLSEDDNGIGMMARPGEGTKCNNYKPDDMEITRSQTVAINAESLHNVNPLQNKKRKSLAFVTNAAKASNTAEDEYGVDMTKAFTVSIDHIPQSDGSRMSDKPLNSLPPKTDDEMWTLNKRDADEVFYKESEGLSSLDGMIPSSDQSPRMDGKCHVGTKGFMPTLSDSDDIEFTRCQTRVIEVANLDVAKPVLSFSTRAPVRTLESDKKHLSEDDNGIGMMARPGEGTKCNNYKPDDMEITRSQTVAINAESLHNVNPLQNKKRKSLAFMTNTAKASNTAEDEYGVDMTKAFTVSIDHIPQSDGSRMSDKPLNSLPPKTDDEMWTLNKRDADEVFYKEGESPSSLDGMIPSSDHNPRMDGKCHVGTKGFMPTLSDSDELEMRRTQTVVSKDVYIADDTAMILINGNLDNFSQPVVPFEGLSKVLHSQASGTDCMRNIPDGSTDLGVPECPSDNLTNHPDSLDSKEMENRKDPEVRHENGSLSQGLEGSPNVSPGVHKVDKLSSRHAQTRRMSLVDLHSKLRRLSHVINEDPGDIAMDSCTAPLYLVDKASDKKSIKTKSLPVVECELEIGSPDKEHDTQSEHVTEGEQSSITAPLNLKTKCLTSRLSLGGFMPKLPQRNKPVEPNKVEYKHVNSVGEHMKANTIDVTGNNILMDISEEVLPNMSSDDDCSSETLDTKGIDEEESPLQRFSMDEPLEEDMFKEPFPSVHGKKRPLPEDYHEDHMEDEKRRKPPTNSTIETGFLSHVQCDSNITATSSVITQTMDPSNRCEATFESTFKQSLLESQLQDYTNDIQKEPDDDSITVLEFFKLFSFDFVIHNARESMLPGKLASNVDRTPKDLLRDRHINHPKQRVYEADYQNLTEKVEGLKARMKDREKLLKSFNRPLWEEMRDVSEKELKCFGAKLKERSNFLRRRSKVQSHELKEVLYSNLQQANLEEQQKLRGKIEQTDEMLISLDDCIDELETELAACEGKCSEDGKPSLRSRQLELEKFTEVLADNERQVCELEIKKEHNLAKLNRLKKETHDLESSITLLHSVNEWKFGEQRSNCTVYTFLYESLHLELTFEECDGNSEQKISDIAFKFQLDGEKSQCHANLVHKLLSQYIEGQTAWVKKYPTSSCVPKLLHDVGLVVSRCRLLGEEVHRLKMWGALRLDILDISCVDTQIHIVFSSIATFSKFEFTVAVAATYPYCVLQVQNFKNHIGSTTIHQIEDIVSSVTPDKNYYTKIVKKIHDVLLC